MNEYSSLNSDDLIELYHKTNKELTKQFLARVPWSEQQEKINLLSSIAKELARRNEGPGHESHHTTENAFAP